MPRHSMSLDTFISKASKKHNNKFDYSLVTTISPSRNKIKIICPIHGIFEQNIHDHLNKKYGCMECSIEYRARNVSLSLDEFIYRCNIVHNFKYDYSKVVYKNMHTFITIICPVHGEFQQLSQEHIIGSECFKCTGTPRKTTDEFICEAINVHGNLYDYSKCVYVDAKTKVDIICSIHGVFSQMPNAHTKGKNGCPICSRSKGELTIKLWLDIHNIYYNQEYRFKDCRYKKTLPFDFYIPTVNMCIEYDGEFHFIPSKHTGGENKLKLTQLRDSIKTQYCLDNNIRLLRIPYTEFDNIETILEKEILKSS